MTLKYSKRPEQSPGCNRNCVKPRSLEPARKAPWKQPIDCLISMPLAVYWTWVVEWRLRGWGL